MFCCVNEKRHRYFTSAFLHAVLLCQLFDSAVCASEEIDKNALRLKAHEMFIHGYSNYMEHAYPDDELMPISCKDTLVVVGEYAEFENAVRLITKDVRFDSDLVVSVFETNIRMVGGLISGHLMSLLVRNKVPGRLSWYSDELLKMAAELADRLLPAFNTTSGIPHSRVNLKHGLLPALKSQQDTCTACAGTMILEWAALSRLTGNPIYEEKARRAMDFLWNQRNRGSDLMGTVLNVHSGDWVRRDSGIGAAYILLGEEDYLYRFNKHYDAVMRYLNKGPVFIDVHMHKPSIASRSYMDALLAFWPGLQVLKGDLKAAMEMHEMLYHVVKKHKFLPDAFTHDLQVHWAQHPLRPEFIESTYLLYRATKDPHYLVVAKQVMDSLEENVRTPCGFAAVKDVRTMDHEDQMESFVLAETFKYLYMIFAEPSDLIFDPDNYVLTTEAHFLPLTIGETTVEGAQLPRRMLIDPDEIIDEDKRFKSACPIPDETRTIGELASMGSIIRQNVNKMLGHLGSISAALGGSEPQTCSKAATNSEHLEQLKKMGIEMEIHPDGRMQLSHSAQAVEPSAAASCVIDLNQLLSTDDSPQTSPTDELVVLHSSRTALLNMTGMILLIFVLWIFLLAAAVVMILGILVLYRFLNRYRKNPVVEKEGQSKGENLQMEADKEKTS
ncbi:glycosyl hydrolase family 47 domain-containing protein [Ditylenchus destructor]|nr:glycosyl hydrolase family 47 domain-containing protein [Ditylenchus destructor]